MKNKHLLILLLTFFLNVSRYFVASIECTHLSADSGCDECNDWGHCVPGSVPVDPWLDFALKTQREIQLDEPFANYQMFDSHNAFNNRGDGFGGNDTCSWPPPYVRPCQSWANHEFSLIDQLNMGVRGLELDNWWCHDAMRLAHMGSNLKIICFERNKLWSSAFEDIANWLAKDGNEGEFVRLYINEKFPQGHDDEFNDPIWENFGNRVVTPEYIESYGGIWPTMRTLREDGKNLAVMISNGADEEKAHGGLYVVRYDWRDNGIGGFTPYPKCGGKDVDDPRTWRYFGDATHYPIVYDGPTGGIILDFKELVKCHIQWLSADMVHPQMMRTGVFTWAEGEPSLDLQSGTCVALREDNRWHVEENCYQQFLHACQSLENQNVWTVSDSRGPYSLTKNICPTGYKFSLPNNGYRQMKVFEAAKGERVWINYSPWLPGYVEPTAQPEVTTPSSAVTNYLTSVAALGACIILGIILY
ncbi:uncharacterized protein MT2135-like [Apostichopus japonicus]|uniref:uncharacterized protein MT2135-like n=1 Tax=Stichopus japonicus TaxID=307972 RepID=UPI003AB8EB35